MYERFEQLLLEKGLKAADITKMTGLKSTVFSEWKSGKSVPKADKLVLIAQALGTTVEYLVTGEESGNETEEGNKYYFSDETAEMAQKLFENSEMRVLFDAARDSRPEDLKTAADFLRRLKETNPDG